jgi:polysaccharide export outer membrane protein
VLALALLASACAAPQPMPPPARPAEKTYRVGSPDTLFVTILPEPILERQVVVRPDGMISIDLIGDVQAAGRTTEDIAQEIQKRVRRFKRDAKATVSIVTSASLSVTVLGEVGAPGTFPLTSETRLSEAIGLRGGTNIFASKRNIRLVRTNGQITRVFTIDLSRIEQGDLTENIMVRGGDLVVVPPNALAKVGYGLQVMLFPFQQLLTAGTAAAAAGAIF